MHVYTKTGMVEGLRVHYHTRRIEQIFFEVGLKPPTTDIVHVEHEPSPLKKGKQNTIP